MRITVDKPHEILQEQQNFTLGLQRFLYTHYQVVLTSESLQSSP